MNLLNSSSTFFIENLPISFITYEMKGSELNRWIAKAVANNEFVKIV